MSPDPTHTSAAAMMFQQWRPCMQVAGEIEAKSNLAALWDR